MIYDLAIVVVVHHSLSSWMCKTQCSGSAAAGRLPLQLVVSRHIEGASANLRRL